MSLSFLWDFFSILYGIVLIVHIYIEIVRNTISVLSRQLSRALCLFLFFVLHGPNTTLLTIFTVRHRSPTMLLLNGKKNELLFADVVLYYYYHCCYLWTVLVRCDRIVECFFFFFLKSVLYPFFSLFVLLSLYRLNLCCVFFFFLRSRVQRKKKKN